jgi:lipopolysaccharide export system permease protein
MFVAYYKVNQYAEQAAAQGRLDPIVAHWVPFFLMAALIGWMYHVIAHRPGGEPIGALDRVFTKAGRFLRSLLPRPQRG